MIDAIDEVLRKLIIRELPVKNGEIDITFEQPKREWSARISRPTLNLFLYDIHENNKLRMGQSLRTQRNNDGTVSQQRQPVRMDVHYMVTAWAADPEDEHRLLSRALLVFLRIPLLPQDMLPESLRNQLKPIPVEVAQPDELRNITDVWSVLDNEMRPAIACTLTLEFDPYAPAIEPLVRTREFRAGQSIYPWLREFDEGVEPDRIWEIAGVIRSEKPLENVRMTLVERGQDVRVYPGGEFAIDNLRAGDYTLEVTAKGYKKPRRRKITVPAESYDIEF